MCAGAIVLATEPVSIIIIHVFLFCCQGFSTSPENVTFTFSGGFAPTSLNMYYSNYEVANPVQFQEMPPVAVVDGKLL